VIRQSDQATDSTVAGRACGEGGAEPGHEGPREAGTEDHEGANPDRKP